MGIEKSINLGQIDSVPPVRSIAFSNESSRSLQLIDALGECVRLLPGETIELSAALLVDPARIIFFDGGLEISLNREVSPVLTASGPLRPLA